MARSTGEVVQSMGGVVDRFFSGRVTPAFGDDMAPVPEDEVALFFGSEWVLFFAGVVAHSSGVEVVRSFGYAVACSRGRFFLYEWSLEE